MCFRGATILIQEIGDVFRRTVSGLLLALLIVGFFVPVFNVHAVWGSGAIYIKRDGSIDPPDAPISNFGNVVYTLTDDVNGSLFVDKDDVVVDGVGHIIAVSDYMYEGIFLFDKNNVTIKNVKIEVLVGWIGIELLDCSNCTISGNNITANYNLGIVLALSNNNEIINNTLTCCDLFVDSSYGNTVENNTVNGKPLVYLEDASDSSVSYAGQVVLVRSNKVEVKNLDLQGTTYPVELVETNNTTISENNITENHCGIKLDSASGNIITENNITENYFGLRLESSHSNTIYHNNFVNNSYQVYKPQMWPDDSTNVWDDGYPSGGNYWSDYNGTDYYCGPYQNATGSDGIGDTPYTIDTDNTDRFPLMYPWSPEHDVAVTNFVSGKTVVGKGYLVSLNVTVENQGPYTVEFDVTTYANSTSIGSSKVSNLASGTATQFALARNTTDLSYGNYTFWAYAEPVLDEADISDNNYTCLTSVHVGVPGDISGNILGIYDGVDNMKDVAYLVSLFNTRPSLSNWNPNADVNNDGISNMKDIAIAVAHFNQYE